MSEKEKRNLDTRAQVGEIVEVTWLDHLAFEGNKTPTKPVVVKSWGKLEYEGKEGVALTQTGVVESEENFPVHSIHTGQFVARVAMTEIKRANGHKK